jgi:arginine decarboxylase
MPVELQEMCTMAAPNLESPGMDLVDFFSAAEARLDRWRQLFRTARAFGESSRGDAEQLRRETGRLLAEIGPLEAFWAYPGPRLLGALRDRAASGDGMGVARLVQRISSALLSGNYRREPDVWEVPDDSEPVTADRLPPTLDHAGNHRPYFEVLIVSPAAPSAWTDVAQQLRRLRRAQDAFVYEPVFVGSFEDALLAVIMNSNIQAVVAYDGFVLRSRHELQVFRDMLARHGGLDDVQPGQDHGTTLARLVKRVRPELDFYLLTDREVERLAGSDAAAPIRRIFYEVEELLELHLSLLDGLSDRYETPYFDNLKRYAQRPMGTFHALPIARGKSIFKSNWIRDMGEFYGVNLFLAESSATTGGLDSLLEPTGNIKVAQDKAARAFGADRCFFATNGTSTSNKIVVQALCKPGDIVLVDRNCHKSHHYGFVLAGAQPLYLEAYPMTAYSMYGAVPLRTIKKALLDLKAESRLDRARIVDLTNCTFDGHIYNVVQVMEECLAIKPDLIFLWDEAWFGFARFSPFMRRRTAMGGAGILRERFADPAYRQRCEAFWKEMGGDLDPKDPTMLDRRLLPDPTKARIRVWETNSTHKSMSALRQGSWIMVADQDFHEVEATFKEAFFTHTSTSPNLQIIASLDVARRQMELEGYEVVMRMTELALQIRREVNSHPLISRYFRVLTPEEMIPAEYRASKLRDYGRPHSTWREALDAMQGDEFALDPTRLTLLCGTAGYDGTQFKNLLASRYDIQLNKTSRNSVLLQTNINNTRSDAAQLVKVLADLARGIDQELREGGPDARAAFEARVTSLMKDVPDLPNFSRFQDAFRTDPKSATSEGDMRAAFYIAYDEGACEYLKLASKEIDERLEKGPELVSASFVIPYPPGFPIMVPGQVIQRDTIDFMRKLDVKEIHGYNAGQGLKLIRPPAARAKTGRPRAS